MKKLRKEDREYLKNIGVLPVDIDLIEENIEFCKYSDAITGQEMTQKQVIEKAGREVWLSGLERSLFHMRATIGGVFFTNTCVMNMTVGDLLDFLGKKYLTIHYEGHD